MCTQMKLINSTVESEPGEEFEANESPLNSLVEIQCNLSIVGLNVTLASICKLPVKLFGEIFWLIVNDNHNGSPRDYDSESWHRNSVLRLSQVCMFWRQIVLNTPRLWRFFLNIGTRYSRTRTSQ